MGAGDVGTTPFTFELPQRGKYPRRIVGMDFAFTKAQEAFRDEFRAWLDENLPPGWTDGDRSLPEDQDAREQFLRDWQRTLYEGGWAGVHWPEEYGGRGATLIEQVIYEQELARVNAPPKLNTIGINFVGPALMEIGTEAQKERYIPNILSGDEIWCQGYSEPTSGSDIASLRTDARAEDDRFVINGQKVWTSYAHAADWCILMTRTDSSGTKHEGITALIVDMNQPGVTVEPIHQASDTREFNQMFFDDATAPRENVVGEVDKGWDVIRIISAFEHAGSRIFDVERLWHEVREYCETHTRGGTRLITEPWIRRKLAEFDVRIEAGKLAHYRNIARRMEEGVPGPEGSLDLVVSDELSNDLYEFALTVRGPETSLWEDGPADGQLINDWLYSYGLWIAAGTGDIQRNIIGEQALGLPKDPKSNTSHREA